MSPVLTNMPMAGSAPAGLHKNLIIGTDSRDHLDLQTGVGHADAFSMFDSDLEYFGTVVFPRDCPWQVKTKLWVLAVFPTFSMTYDRPTLHC
jgi:hypothetical protein